MEAEKDLMQEPDLSIVDSLVEGIGRSRRHVIPLLQAIQERFHYLPREALRRVCEITEITPADITGVSTFYNQFRHAPAGEHMVHICLGTACHVKGADFVYDAFQRYLNIKKDQDTDPKRLFTLDKVACLGCCTLAPVVQIDGITYGHLKPDTVPHVIHDFLVRESGHAGKAGKKRSDEKVIGEIRIGLGSCCVASGSANVHRALEEALEKIDTPIRIKRVGCVGMCHRVPLLEVNVGNEPPVHYSRVQPENIRNILDRHMKPGPRGKLRRYTNRLLENLLSDDGREPASHKRISFRDAPVAAFLDRQKHIATECYGTMDPTDIGEYRSQGGFSALEQCLKQGSPESVIDAVTRSGLRGRGGAGFPTGKKWAAVRAAHGDKKYVVCNGDEGDPGAFMDRMLLESYPYRVIEGMTIAAFAAGAHEGYFYIRAEYPLAVERVNEALEMSRKEGFTGENILDTGFSLDLRVMEGAGAFVCGEETALIASIEGRRGMPRRRPPFPAEKGLWQCPTLINNVETYSLVPWIFRNSPEDFAAIGTEKSKGTKVFALAGKITRGGLIEVPMGITIQEIVSDIGGGMAGGRRFKALQIGGPSGGCIPAHLAHTPVDFDELIGVGAMMGSGGLVALDDSDCMVDIAKYFLSFTQSQSCGKCTFCRVGTRRMLDILERLTTGEGKKEDLEKLEYLAEKTKLGSLCGLGRTAPNPVLTTLRYFREEYEAHIDGICPARKCRPLIRYTIEDTCIGCTKCAQHCPVQAIALKPYEKHDIDTEKCIRCDTCRQICPAEAVIIRSP